MILIGLLYQFDGDQGTGALMVGDGEKKEFRIEEWVDSINTPAVGQKIAYEHNGYRAQIRVATEDDIKRAQTEKENEVAAPKAPQNSREFNNADACVAYFLQKGFKKVKDSDRQGIRTISLRSLINGDPHEVVAIQEGETLQVTLTVNGKLEPIV